MGKTLSEETKRKMSESKLGKKKKKEFLYMFSTQVMR